MKAQWHSLSLTLLSAAVLGTVTAYGGQFKRITIDGNFNDWAGVAPAAVDAEDASGTLDFKEIYLANDEDYLYVRVKLYSEIDYSKFHHHVFIDADADPGTGFSIAGIGSELMIEDGGGYQQASGQWNAGNATELGWAEAPTGSTKEFELRISRKARDAGGTLVFANPNLALAVEAENSGWTTVDVAPDSSGAAYEFAATPPKATGTQSLLSLAGSAWRYNDAGTDLGADWLAIDYDDTQAGWASGNGLFGFGVTAGVYPALNTALTTGHSAYYLRAPFTWDYDTTGIALTVNNYLSDGAVFYLNGVEVKRVRMPEGAVAYSTPATGGPATPGQAEFFTLPPDALVTGANLLEVEVHQASATPAELAFGLKLDATDSLPPAIDDPSQPADRSIVEGEATTFSAGNVSGSVPLTYQWFKDGAAIDGATGPTLTIPMVLVTDAGGYRVEIGNATGIKVTSRTAQLSTTATPVSFVSNAEPVDRSILQGESTTFSVNVAGSPTLHYQWLKNGQPIDGATGESYAIDNAVLADAGQYAVTVSNRVNAVTSRAAQLGVLADVYAPLINQVSGSAKKVVVVFSEPVDAASAKAAGNYTLSGGAQVQGAALDAADQRTVTLTTASALSFGSVYTLGVNGVKDRFGNAAATSAPFRATILIDDNLDDWAGIAPAVTETQDTVEGMEFKDITVTNDENYLYIRFSFYANVGQLPVDAYFHIFSDTDNDLGTGSPQAGVGSEMMIENLSGYQQKGGGFNEGGVSGLDLAVGPAAAASDFECRISRKATYDTDGQLVYNQDTIALGFQLISGAWASLDLAPAGGGLVYTFATLPPLNPGPLHVRATGGKVELTWAGGGVLEARDSLSAGAWTPVTGAASPYLADPTGQQRYFRLKAQ